MSNNPYSPPEYVPPKTTRRLLVRRDFPFWSIGPLTWITVVLLTCLMITINLSSPLQGDFLFSILMYCSLLAAFYGTLYAFVLSLICRVLKVQPRPQLHFWTVLATTVLMILSEQSILLTLCMVTFVGGCVAVGTARKKAAA